MDKIETEIERRRRLAKERAARYRAIKRAPGYVEKPKLCCVPFCNGNYPSGPKVSVFYFPTEAVLLKKWLAAIPNEDLVPTRSTQVCQKHFKPEDIITETSAFDSKKQVTLTVKLKNYRLKPDAVPCIFEDIPVQRVKKVNNSPKEKQEKDNSDGTNLIMEEDKSPEIMEECVDKEEDDIIEVDDSPSPNPAPLSSPLKNMPNVSVCLKEEDRVPGTRELKGVKRSPSTGSNSSTGSSDAQKSNISVVKRRKIEKPAPVVIGRQNDCYCWVCHRENIVLCCIACPRAYHPKCAGEPSLKSSDWVCPECQKILAAENVDTRSSTLAEISLDKLGALLKLSLNKMKQRAPIAFHQPVSLDHYPLYLHYVIHPMDFSLLEKNIKQKLYGCTEAFLADVKWISHNSCVFNGTQHPLSTNAKNLVKACDQDMQEIEVCPDCFVHSVVRNKYWFSDVCRKPHPLVWAKLKGFPYWPAKVVRILDGNVDARFFGAHDRAWVPVSQCYHLSKEMPTTSKPKKKGNYEVALDELNVHVHLLIQEFGCFEYAPYRTSFNTENKYLMYHGIDVNKVAKKDISFDISSPVPEKYHSSEKENRFASFLEAEQEKSNSDEIKSSEKLPEKLMNNPFKVTDRIKSPFFFSERKSTDSLLSEKETVESESSQEKSTLEDKTNDQKKTVELKKPDSVQVSPIKISEKVSASDQFRKLELALERIKGYVSLTAEPEKESESQSEDKEVNKKGGEIGKSPEKKEETKTITLSPLFKETIKLPEIETNSTEESNIELAKLLEPSRKTDSFVLKLNETIESCKASLGISEIIDDDSSDESGADENASRSEDEEDNSSSSEVEEESSDEEVEDEDDGESEVMDISDEELENGNEGNESTTDEDENSKSGGESESSGTDIESHNNEASPKRADNINNVNIKDSVNSESEVDKNRDVMKDNFQVTLVEDIADKETNIPNPDIQISEVTNDLEPLEIIGEHTDNESSKHGKISSPNKDLNQTNYPLTLSPSQLARIRTAAHEHNTKQINCKDKSEGTETTINEKASPPKMNSESMLLENNADKSDNEHEIPKNSSAMTPKHDSVEEDDDIFICTPTRPKSPPVIVLDDDVENEDSSVSDTYAVKTPPYSTSVESFSNEEIPAPSTNSGDKSDRFSPSKAAMIKRRSSSESSLKKNNENGVLDSVDSHKKRKRKLSSEESSDDDIQIVTPVKKVGLTGAKRTFNKANAVESMKRVSPTLDSVRRNLTKEGLEKTPSTPPAKVTEVEETESLRTEPTEPEHEPESENILKSPVLEGRNLTEHEKEVLFLKRKLQCLMTAYKIQGWKCHQEREELRHNMNLIIMEMRACLESDKKQAIDILVRKHEQEKQKFIEETKRKQWCATCLSESRYACCWNTSYCSIDCQKRHFPEHRKACTQVSKVNKPKFEIKSSPLTSDNNEGKKLIILNMKNDSGNVAATDKSVSGISQQTPSNKPEIQVLSPSNTVQIPTSNQVQFVLAPVKSPTESNVATTAPSALNLMEKNLDSAQIITHVRNKACDLGTAISLLKKKNLESTLSILSKKKEAEEVQKEDASLEDVYFPSPPKITFEGYDSVSPEPNLALHDIEEAILNCDADSETSLPEELVPERDVDLSDTDEMDNVMVSIGHSVVVKAKFLNKCLVYGKTAKKLTRCLVDIIFPDIRLLASCSAFGQKSNVTKLTRAALPARKVYAIIDFVTKRFPYATRSEIVLAINMKCKEARIMLKRNIDPEKKTATRRLLAKEQEDEIASTTTVTTAGAITAIVPTTAVGSVTVSPPSISTSATTIISTVPKTSPNVVCVKSSPHTLPFGMSKKPSTMPNILRCTPQLIMPKPLIPTSSSQQASLPSTSQHASPVFQTPLSLASGSQQTSVFQIPSQPRKRETVKELLSKQSISVGNAAKDGSNHTPGVVSIGSPSIRPYIIMGAHGNVAMHYNQQPPVQNPALPEPPKK